MSHENPPFELRGIVQGKEIHESAPPHHKRLAFSSINTSPNKEDEGTAAVQPQQEWSSSSSNSLEEDFDFDTESDDANVSFGHNPRIFSATTEGLRVTTIGGKISLPVVSLNQTSPKDSSSMIITQDLYYSTDDDELDEDDTPTFLLQDRRPAQRRLEVSEDIAEDEEEVKPNETPVQKPWFSNPSPNAGKASRFRPRTASSWEAEHLKLIERRKTSNYEWHTSLSDFDYYIQENVRRNAPVLEIGCGLSSLSIDLALRGYSDVTAIDWSPVAVASNRERALGFDEVQYRCMDAKCMDFNDGAFLAVICKAMLDFVDHEYEVDRILREDAAAKCWWSCEFLAAHFALEFRKPIGTPVGTLHQHKAPFSLLLFRKSESLQQKQQRLHLDEVFQANVAIAQELLDESKANRRRQQDERRRFWQELSNMEMEDLESQTIEAETRYVFESERRAKTRRDWDRMARERYQMELENALSHSLRSWRLDSEKCAEVALSYIIDHAVPRRIQTASVVSHVLDFVSDQAIRFAESVNSHVLATMQAILQKLDAKEDHVETDIIEDEQQEVVQTSSSVPSSCDDTEIAAVMQDMIQEVENRQRQSQQHTIEVSSLLLPQRRRSNDDTEIEAVMQDMMQEIEKRQPIVVSSPSLVGQQHQDVVEEKVMQLMSGMLQEIEQNAELVQIEEHDAIVEQMMDNMIHQIENGRYDERYTGI